MSDLRELYQEVILDHGKNPRNFREIDGANRRADGHNPLCGDRVKITLEVEDGIVRDVGFTGSGCAISTASASIMTSAIKGKPVGEVRALFDRFRGIVTGDPNDTSDEAELGKLAVFKGVCEFPSRVKCATLAWHTMARAISSADAEPEGPATTE